MRMMTITVTLSTNPRTDLHTRGTLTELSNDIEQLELADTIKSAVKTALAEANLSDLKLTVITASAMED